MGISHCCPEVVLEGRKRFSVFEAVLREFRQRILLDSLSIDDSVVMDNENAVRTDMDIEFACAETGFAGTAKGCNGVACISGFITVPESAMCHYRNARITRAG